MSKKHAGSKNVVLSVGEASKTVELLKRAAAEKSLTTRLKSKLSQAAAELEVRVRLARDGQVSIPKKFVRMVLQGMVYLVHFRREIREVANSLIGIIK